MVLFFYGFAMLIVFCAIMVVLSLNPVHSILWLILAFCNGAGLMVIIGAEFIAMMLVIIYVGAVAVLFLFIIMMLDIKLIKPKGAATSEKIFAFFLSGFLFIDLSLVIFLGLKVVTPYNSTLFVIAPSIGNVYAIGRVLYTEFILPFQTIGVILFVSVIASITLTVRSRPGFKRQSLSSQLFRNKDNSLVISKSKGILGLDNLNYED